MFRINEYFPPAAHKKRVQRYRENKKLFLGQHADVFLNVQNRLSPIQRELVYISVNLPGIIAKKSADFLFGETATFSAGLKDDAPEQEALDRLVTDNDLHILNYEGALSAAFRGDSFYKVRWGQEYGGRVPKTLDPFRVWIEAQNAEYVFPETDPGNASKIIAYHIAFPQLVKTQAGDQWILNVESHFPGYIEYRKFRLNPIVVTVDNEITEWKITNEIFDAQQTVETGVPFPLVVHVPNYSTDDAWEGIDDLTEHRPIFDEINNRLSRITEILDKHSDPAMVVPAGTLGEDEFGNPTFRAGVDKVFEAMGKEDITPQYITWDGQLQAAFTQLDKLVNLLLMNAELPAVALGGNDAGTSGSSGLAIKFRMNSLLAKINRKRQYFDKALKRTLLIAQLLEQAQLGRIGYEPTVPKITFRDGLPNDEFEMAQIAQVRTGGKATMSQKAALMWLDHMTEEQADAELERMKAEEETVSPSIFNESNGGAA